MVLYHMPQVFAVRQAKFIYVAMPVRHIVRRLPAAACENDFTT